jgi:hypothetical protein
MATQPSGKQWVTLFPDAKTTAALADDFRAGCEAFIAAMRAGGATVTVSSTRRPDERAYLMFVCWRIAKKTLDPQNAPADAAVDIDWVHRAPDGSLDLAASRAAAQDMVDGYDIAFAPARHSRHTEGHAIDMTISWQGNLAVARRDGTAVTIAGTPRNGFNLALRGVGKTYGVMKHPTDPPHWSTDGH